MLQALKLWFRRDIEEALLPGNMQKETHSPLQREEKRFLDSFEERSERRPWN